MKIKSVTNRLKDARINAGYSQRDVQKITEFIKFQALSNYEHDRSIPSNKTFIELSKLYHVSIDYLFCNDDYRNHEEYIINELGLTSQSISILKKLKHSGVDISPIKQFIIQLKESEEQ